MFTRGFSILLAGLLFTAAIAKAATVAPPPLPPAVATVIAAAYTNQCALLKNTDIDGYGKTLTSKWTGSDPNGTTHTKTQAMDSIKQQIAAVGLTITDCSTTISGGTVSSGGNMVNATVTQSVDGTVATQSGTAPVHVDTTELDIWVKRGANWLQQSSAVSKTTLMVNGQVVQQSGSR